MTLGCELKALSDMNDSRLWLAPMTLGREHIALNTMKSSKF